MLITTDSPNSNPSFITAKGEESEPFKLFDYVLITYKEQQWIGQITKPNINISTSGLPHYDPTLLHGLERYQEDSEIQLIDNVEMWEIQLLGEYNNAALSTVRRRPKPGGSVVRLDRETTIHVLKLPELISHSDNSQNVIGELMNAEDVPLCVDRKIFNHHIMVSGGTGSGKSNVGANLIDQSAKLGYCVFLYDAKPDYQKMDEANSEANSGSIKEIFKKFSRYRLKPEGAKNLKRVCFYSGESKDYTSYHAVFGYQASDLDPYIFANLILPDTASDLQRDEFISTFYTLQRSSPSFGLQNIKESLETKVKSADRAITSTINAIIRAIERKVNAKELPWLDSVGTTIGTSTGNAFSRSQGGQVVTFKPKTLVEAGCIIHIDCEGLTEANYALFLSIFIRECQNYRNQNRSDVPVVQFIDEAHRVFDKTSKYHDSLASVFNRAMREGRTLQHGVILSLQNSSQVPHLVVNNLNSHIVMKQNSREVAKFATQSMGEELAVQTMNLGRGQALVKLFESSAVVLAQMAPSPFELQRSDNQ